MFQTTLDKQVSFSGVGLHSGSYITVTVKPSFPDTGIQFVRTDVDDCEPTKVSPFAVYSTQLATSIKCGKASISTIEHLTSALYGLGIDNAVVEVNSAEIPILDGSAAPFVDILSEAGIRHLHKKRKYLKFKKRIRVEWGERWVEVIPSRFLKFTCHIDFENKIIDEQKAFFNVTPGTFKKEIAKARTFGFKNEIESLWQMGLAKGGSLENAVVVDESGVLNAEGLRYEDEFVRHKMLDLIGDVSLIGYRFFGHVRAYKAGHQLNNMFARALLESSDYYTVVELDGEYEKKGYQGLVLEPQGIV